MRRRNKVTDSYLIKDSRPRGLRGSCYTHRSAVPRIIQLYRRHLLHRRRGCIGRRRGCIWRRGSWGGWRRSRGGRSRADVYVVVDLFQLIGHLVFEALAPVVVFVARNGLFPVHLIVLIMAQRIESVRAGLLPGPRPVQRVIIRSEEHTSELQSRLEYRMPSSP